jgi:tRNA threonylcarbamoyladenosine biosynthesis protein TsaE
MHKSIVDRQVESESAMHELAAELAAIVPAGTVIYLIGSLGAGKTTFTRGYLYALHYQGKVKSPTYTLVEPYQTEKYDVFHFDLYRLNVPEELINLGIEDYFQPAAVCLVEWPDKGAPYLPPPDLTANFDIMTDKKDVRSVRLHACTLKGEEILARL